MREMLYSELVRALSCCAPADITAEPNCSACPVERDSGPGGQCWCSIAVMQQACNALTDMMRSNAKLRDLADRFGGHAWRPVTAMEPDDGVLVWIRREPMPGYEEITTGCIEDGMWYVNGILNAGGRVTHWMDYLIPSPPEVSR